jgi:hypothetical protein
MVKVYNFKYINCYLYCEELHCRQAGNAQRVSVAKKLLQGEIES